MVEHMECPRAFLGKLVPEHFFFPLRTALRYTGSVLRATDAVLGIPPPMPRAAGGSVPGSLAALRSGAPTTVVAHSQVPLGVRVKLLHGALFVWCFHALQALQGQTNTQKCPNHSTFFHPMSN